MCDKNGISGGEGVRFGSQFLKNPEGRGVIGKIPSVGGGVWIFSGTTHSEIKGTKKNIQLKQISHNILIIFGVLHSLFKA